MYAITKHSGKQYKASVGGELKLDHFEAESKASIEVGEVFAINDRELEAGTPFVAGTKAALEAVNHGKDKKIVIHKKRRRKDSKLKCGFRRQFTHVVVKDIKAWGVKNGIQERSGLNSK